MNDSARIGAAVGEHQSPDEPAMELVWHPAIRALGWVKDGVICAMFLAITWQSLASGELSWASAAPIVARACAIAVALALLFVAEQVVELWWSFFQHARRNYRDENHPGLSPYSMIVSVVTVVTLAILGAYGLLVVGIFHWLWPLLKRLSRYLPFPSSAHGPVRLSAWSALWILLITVALTCLSLAPVIMQYVRARRLFGTAKLLQGMAVMLLLRYRQPRKDFFLQAPPVGQIPWFTSAAVLAAILPSPWFSRTAPLVIVLWALGLAVNYMLPPAWLFLGRSEFESFRVFDGLRYRWRIFGVTLLNRDSRAWAEYYFAEAARLARSGYIGAAFMKKPRTPRVWSLRSRPDMWQHTVWLLMKHAKFIVIDVRGDWKSYFIFDEVLWLAELRLTEKTWLLGKDDRSAPALDSALEWGREEGVMLKEPTADHIRSRLVTEQQLYAAQWSGSGLRMSAGK